jgi:hypothetical protein
MIKGLGESATEAGGQKRVRLLLMKKKGKFFRVRLNFYLYLFFLSWFTFGLIRSGLHGFSF